MEKLRFTIGMAGHIDHGKTTLTKALTNVDTDRLKEEKERQISIELGFAPFYLDKSMQVSIIDVPGHERFIRQMIAGVAGIDLVLLVVAADEGVMPQTKEHLEILSFLGIKHGIVVITKIDKVEEDFIDLVKEDIRAQLHETVFEKSPIVLVDSHSKKGIPELRETIIRELHKVESRNISGAFRLPIDQVFTVKGQGTVVRGTVYEGTVQQGEMLTLLPEKIEVRARQLQTHHEAVNHASAGQRVAVNLSNVTKNDLKRGDVLVSSNLFSVTNTIDVALRFVQNLKYTVKQRIQVKCHIGTSEVMGKIVFFDRNEIDGAPEEILCQLRLDEPIVAKRGDRFIIRRPTPAETIGGGWVIDSNGMKHKFGVNTMKELERKKEGAPKERMMALLEDAKLLSINEIAKKISVDISTLSLLLKDSQDFVEVSNQIYTTTYILDVLFEKMKSILQSYHQEFPLRFGLNKAELLQQLSIHFPKELIEYCLEKKEKSEQLRRNQQYIQLADFKAHFPEKWSKRMEGLLDTLEKDGLQVKMWDEYVMKAGVPQSLESELKHFLLETNQIYSFDGKMFIHHVSLQNVVTLLRKNTNNEFEIKDVKDILNVSRKYVVPLLELLDYLKLTKRVENKRVWAK